MQCLIVCPPCKQYCYFYLHSRTCEHLNIAFTLIKYAKVTEGTGILGIYTMPRNVLLFITNSHNTYQENPHENRICQRNILNDINVCYYKIQQRQNMTSTSAFYTYVYIMWKTDVVDITVVLHLTSRDVFHFTPKHFALGVAMYNTSDTHFQTVHVFFTKDVDFATIFCEKASRHSLCRKLCWANTKHPFETRKASQYFCNVLDKIINIRIW